MGAARIDRSMGVEVVEGVANGGTVCDSRSMLAKSNWALFFMRGEHRTFFEVRVVGSQLWTAEGTFQTFGVSQTRSFDTEADARDAFGRECEQCRAKGYELERHAFINRAAPDFELLADEVTAGARSAFDSVRAAHPDQQLDAFALYSDSDAMTICHMVNSREEMAKVAEEDHPDFKWICQEWSLEEGGDELEVAYRLILLHHRGFPFEVERGVYREGVFDACIRALERLDAEGAFGHGKARDGVRVLFEVSDDEDVPGAHERLNPPAVFAAYKAWRRSWD